MLGPYGPLLRAPDVAALFASSLPARMPISMVALGIVLFVRERTGSFGAAGLVEAAFAAGAGLSARVLGRLIDRLGQTRVLIPGALLDGAALAGLVGAGRLGAPVAALVPLAPRRAFAALAIALPLGCLPLLAAAAPSTAAMLVLAPLAGLVVAPLAASRNEILGALAPRGTLTEAFSWVLMASVVRSAAGRRSPARSSTHGAGGRAPVPRWRRPRSAWCWCSPGAARCARPS